MAEEMLADFHKTPAHTIVTNQRRRYHFTAIFCKKYARLAVVGFVWQQQIGKLFQPLLSLTIIRGSVDGREHIIGRTVGRRWVKNNFVWRVHIGGYVTGNIHDKGSAPPTPQRRNQQGTCLTSARRAHYDNVPLVWLR